MVFTLIDEQKVKVSGNVPKNNGQTLDLGQTQHSTSAVRISRETWNLKKTNYQN